MPLDIESVRENIQKGEVKIRKGEGITHALLRACDSENANKSTKELEKIFLSLDRENKRMLKTLAEEVAENAPFSARPKKTALLGDILTLTPQSIAPSDSSIPDNTISEGLVPPVEAAPMPTVVTVDDDFQRKEYPGSGVYTGQFVEGKRHGIGSFIDSSENGYSGEWKDNMRNGGGQLVFSDGSYYDGTFRDDDFETGKFYNADGTTSTKDGENESDAEVSHEDTEIPIQKKEDVIPVQYPEGEYRGTYESDLRSGYGIMNFQNGDYYKGEWKNDMRDGKGLYIRNGNRFIGVFKENQFYIGELTDASQRIVSTYTDGEETIIIPQDVLQTHTDGSVEKKVSIGVKKIKNKKQNHPTEKSLEPQTHISTVSPEVKSAQKPIINNKDEVSKNLGTQKKEEYSPLSGVPNPNPSDPISEESVKNEFRKPNFFQKLWKKWFLKDSEK